MSSSSKSGLFSQFSVKIGNKRKENSSSTAREPNVSIEGRKIHASPFYTFGLKCWRDTTYWLLPYINISRPESMVIPLLIYYKLPTFLLSQMAPNMGSEMHLVWQKTYYGKWTIHWTGALAPIIWIKSTLRRPLVIILWYSCKVGPHIWIGSKQFEVLIFEFKLLEQPTMFAISLLKS